ncbi:PucR family transcriptional regulator [Rhodococcus koreensis]
MAGSRELWPTPSKEARSYLRSIATRLLPHVEDILDDLITAQQQSSKDPSYADGNIPLAAIDRRITRTNVEQWLSHNIDKPGLRVPIADMDELTTYARDLALRGLDANDVESWRASQRLVFAWWLEACFASEVPAGVIREVIEVAASSLTTFSDDSIAALEEHVRQTRTELADPPYLQRQATVQSLLQGAQLDPKETEARLRYPLTGSHVAAIVWADTIESTPLLQPVADQLIKAISAANRLLLVAGISTMWLWIRADDTPAVDDLRQAFHDVSGIHVAFGRPGHDIAGFRRSHDEASAAKRMLDRLKSRWPVVRYQDVQVLSLITQDMNEADVFVSDTLGDLADAGEELRTTVRTFIHERFNTSHTADRLYAHRNTIDRRLTKAYELLPRPLTENASAVDIALLLVELKGDKSQATRAHT